MTINQLVDMAERIHDAEGWNLGASSSRATRNAFWERVIGCAYWGHPVYNATPDKQWHCKDPDGPQAGSRPPSDDVAVSMPSRNAWDCIPGAGGDGYRFEADSSPFFLPPEQFVFVPSKPAGSGTTPPVIPPAASAYPYPDEPTFWKLYTHEVKRRYPGGVLNDDAFRWFSRCGHNSGVMPPPDAAAKALKELDAITGGPLP